MKIKAEYKGKTVEIDIPDEKLEELVKEQKKTGWEKPQNDNYYWYIGSDNCVFREVWKDGLFDNIRCDKGNCFTSKELADNIARYQSLDRRIRRRIAEICEPVDWNKTEQRKWTIDFIHSQKHIATYGYTSVQFGTWLCDTEAHAEQIINEFREELMWYFTEFKDRMDG